MLEALIPIFAIFMVFSIPIIAIWTSYKLKMKRLENEGGSSEDVKTLKREMTSMLYENELLQERIEQLESIVSELPQVSLADRKKLQINIQPREMTELEIERQKLIDNK